MTIRISQSNAYFNSELHQNYYQDNLHIKSLAQNVDFNRPSFDFFDSKSFATEAPNWGGGIF